jgi:uncharacterized membrane protein YdfJ with MMPL/SSD domain
MPNIETVVMFGVGLMIGYVINILSGIRKELRRSADALEALEEAACRVTK